MKNGLRNQKSLVTLLFMSLLLTGRMSLAVRPASAATVHAVSLDASSTTTSDTIVSVSATDAQSFRVGAVVNSTNASPINDVQGWQFTINYNATAFLPQGDPSPLSSYPDGASNTVLFGAQTGTGAVNWAGLVVANSAFASFSVNSFLANGQITIFFTILSPNPTVAISANCLLANVNFELIAPMSAPQTFTISNVIFVDGNLNQISGVVQGGDAVETATNDPPIAALSYSPNPSSGPLAFIFNGTGSSDSDGTIANPTGYFWDFGDGTQDPGVGGPVVVHDYAIAGVYNVTLRVEDNLGATGAARGSLGNVLVNRQPSHASIRITAGTTNLPPFAAFNFSPSNPATGQTVQFNGSASFDPDGFIVNWFWDFGDGSFFEDNTSLATHRYPAADNYTVTLVVLDNGNATGIVSASVPVGSGPTLVAVDMNPGTPNIIETNASVAGNFTVNVDVVDVSNLFGWQFALGFNNTSLSTSNASISLGPFWQSAIATNHAILVADTVSPNGTISIAVTLLDSAPMFTGTGVLVTISFTSTHQSVSSLHLSNTILVTNLNSTVQVIPSITQDGFVIALPIDQPPVARFIFNPARPVTGEPVFFDASQSFDVDGFIVLWRWTFGDGSFINGGGPIAYHTYISPGNYTVTLLVMDNVGFSSSTSLIVQVSPQLQHDVGIQFIYIYPQVALSSAFVNIQAGVTNKGLSDETVSVTVYANSVPISTTDGIRVSAPPPGCMSCSSLVYVPVLWDTQGVAAGNYTISATVFLSTDQDLSDNSLTDGQVKLLPPPVITLTPTSGSLGTKVLVHGSGFLNPSSSSGSPTSLVLVSFDDMTLGFTIIRLGTFDFTFDVPHAQPGPHMVKALDEFSGTRSNAVFTVTANVGNLSVDVNVGTIYFPGDKASIFVLATLNGVPASPSSSTATAVLIKPDGTNTSLSLIFQGGGLYKAVYDVPVTASIGTYAVLVRVHMAGPLDSASVTTFEVKLAWLSTGQGKATITTAAIVGVAGMLAVFWKKGYIRRREDTSIPTF